MEHPTVSIQSKKSNQDLLNVINGRDSVMVKSPKQRDSQSLEGSQWGKSINFSPRSNQAPFSNGTLQNGFTQMLLSGDNHQTPHHNIL